MPNPADVRNMRALKLSAHAVALAEETAKHSGK